MTIEPQIPEWWWAWREHGVYFVPVIAFAESCVGIGLFVSGAFLVVVCSFLYGEQLASLAQLLPLAFLGAALGDHLGFYAGRWVGPRLHHTGFAERHQARLARAEALIRRFGAGAIFIGRFIPAIRSIVPLMTGISEFGRARYTVLDLLACALWAAGLAVIVVGVDNVLGGG